MRRRRYQKGSLGVRQHGAYQVWVGQWRENGERRSKVLGRVVDISKSDAWKQLAALLYPINSGQHEGVRAPMTLGDFVTTVFIPLNKRGR